MRYWGGSLSCFTKKGSIRRRFSDLTESLSLSVLSLLLCWGVNLESSHSNRLWGVGLGGVVGGRSLVGLGG